MDEATRTGRILLIDGARGRYIPQHFARWLARDFKYPDDHPTLAGKLAIDAAYLMAPGGEDGDEVWTDIVDNAICIAEGYEGWTLDLGEAGDVYLAMPASLAPNPALTCGPMELRLTATEVYRLQLALRRYLASAAGNDDVITVEVASLTGIWRRLVEHTGEEN